MKNGWEVQPCAQDNYTRKRLAGLAFSVTQKDSIKNCVDMQLLGVIAEALDLLLNWLHWQGGHRFCSVGHRWVQR